LPERYGSCLRSPANHLCPRDKPKDFSAILWFVLVPLSLASLLTGLVQSLGTPWGLFRHYWVLFKLLINVLATIVLLMYMQTLTYLGGSLTHLGRHRTQELITRLLATTTGFGTYPAVLMVLSMLLALSPTYTAGFSARAEHTVG
jgi:hypothetical protein